MYSSSVLLASSLVASALASNVPSNVKSFYSSVKSAGQCKDKLATGFYSYDGGPDTWSYCGDHLDDDRVIYIQGTGGLFANMDIDCDGQQGGAADDGRCGKSGDTQSITSFQDTVSSYGIEDVNANIHPYVVFGNSGTKSGYATFDPQDYGIEPLSVMAVVCGDKLIYGVWADENGDDGDHAMVGEASISLATACYGTSINGNSGHDENDVLYIAFPGSDAVPGKSGAKWTASNYDEFEASIQSLGNKLVSRIGSSGGQASGSATTTATATSTAKTTTRTSSTSKATATCSWSGHCAGATCSDENDCAGDLTCHNGKCA